MEEELKESACGGGEEKLSTTGKQISIDSSTHFLSSSIKNMAHLSQEQLLDFDSLSLSEY